MIRTWPTVALLALLSAPGCVAPLEPQDGTEPLPQATRLVLPFGLEDCDFVVAMVPVDAVLLSERVPRGFQLVTTGPPIDGVPSALLGLEAFACTSEGLGDEPVGYAYGSVFTAVSPNATFLKESVDEYYVKWDTLVANATKRDEMRPFGVAAFAGSVNVALDVTGPIGIVQADLDMGEGGSFSIQATGNQVQNAPGFEYIEYVPAANESLGAWHSTTQARTLTFRGQGVVNVDPTSWFGAILGGGPISAQVATGTWSFAPGNITVPVESANDVH